MLYSSILFPKLTATKPIVVEFESVI